MADLNSILYGQGVPEVQQVGIPQVPSGVLPPGPAMGMPPVMAPMPTPEQGPAVGQAQAPQQAPQQEPGFLSLMDRIRSDPAMMQGALMAGIRLAQGARPGQNALGLVGDALMMGVTAHDMLQGNQRKQSMEDQDFQVTQAQKAATLEGTQLQNEEAKQTLPAKVKSLITKADMLERAGKLDKAQEVVNLAKASFQEALLRTPVYEQAWLNEIQNTVQSDELKRQLMDAQIQGQYSNMGVDSARILELNARTEETIAKTQEPEKYRRTLAPTAEEVRIKMMQDMIKQANPDIGQKELAQLTLQQLTSAKTQDEMIRFQNHLLMYDVSNPKGRQQALDDYVGLYGSLPAGVVGGKSSPTGRGNVSSTGVSSQANTGFKSGQQYDDYVKQKVASGKYSSEAEVIKALKDLGYTRPE